MVKWLRKALTAVLAQARPSLTNPHGTITEKGWISETFELRIDGVLIDQEVDVYPLNDVMVHAVPGNGCNCGPASSILENGIALYIHHSLDGREFHERARVES